jgi:hypothetical protein
MALTNIIITKYLLSHPAFSLQIAQNFAYLIVSIKVGSRLSNTKEEIRVGLQYLEQIETAKGN